MHTDLGLLYALCSVHRLVILAYLELHLAFKVESNFAVGKATKGHGHLGHSNAPATLPALLPHPTMGRHDLGACGGQAQPSGRFARMGNKVGQLHGQLRAAKTPQQELGQGAAGMLQEHQGWVMRLQGRP